MRTLTLVALLAVAACSSSSSPDRRDAGRHADTESGGRRATPAPVSDGGSAAAATRYTGTLRGQTEVPDGGLPDGGTVWRGEGSVTLDVRGVEVAGRLEATEMVLEAKGNLSGGTLRAWLRAPAGQPRTEGVLLGDSTGDRLTGTWRVSGPAGAEIRAGTFEVGH